MDYTTTETGKKARRGAALLRVGGGDTYFAWTHDCCAS